MGLRPPPAARLSPKRTPLKKVPRTRGATSLDRGSLCSHGSRGPDAVRRGHRGAGPVSAKRSGYYVGD